MEPNNDLFINQCLLNNDTCWREAKDLHNRQIDDYRHYNTNFVQCKDPNIRIPTFHYDHVNLRGRPGYGVSDDCLIDNDSILRNDQSRMTRDKCSIQLIHRTFTGGPNLRPGAGDPEKELDILHGSNSMDVTAVNQQVCNKKQLSEEQTYKFIPMLDCIQDIQHHEYESWARGGEATRDFVNKKKFLETCGLLKHSQGSWVA